MRDTTSRRWKATRPSKPNGNHSKRRCAGPVAEGLRSRSSGLNLKDLHAAPRFPAVLFACALAHRTGDDQRLSVGRELRMGDALLRIDGMHETAIRCGEERGVPVALRLAPRHDEVRGLWMPRY